MPYPHILDLEKLFDQIHVGIVIHAHDTRILYANQAAQDMLNLNLAQLMGREASNPDWHFIHPNGSRLDIEDYPVSRVLRTREPLKDLELGILDATLNQPTWVSVSATPELDQAGQIFQVVVSFVDISTQRNNFSFQQVVDFANDIVVVTEASPLDEPGPRIVYVNQAFTTLTEYTPDEVLGKSPRFLQGERTNPDARQIMRDALEKKQDCQSTILNYSKSGRPYWLEVNIVPITNWAGEVTHFAAIERDVTTTKMTEQKLRDDACQDPLTGLLNRRGLDLHSQEVEAYSAKIQAPFSVIALDLDHFKQINDSYGHAAGDQVLVALAQLLQANVRAADTVARVGGEEFVILLPETPLKTAASIAERIRLDWANHDIAIPSTSSGEVTTLRSTTSLGIAQYAPGSAAEPNVNATLKQADEALYQAKHQGRNRVEVRE